MKDKAQIVLWFYDIRVLPHSTLSFRCTRVFPFHITQVDSQKWSFAFCAGKGSSACIPWALKTSVHKTSMAEAEAVAAAIYTCFQANTATSWHFTVRRRCFSCQLIAPVRWHILNTFSIFYYTLSQSAAGSSDKAECLGWVREAAWSGSCSFPMSSLQHDFFVLFISFFHCQFS